MDSWYATQKLMAMIDNLEKIYYYSTFQVSEVHSRGRDRALPCPYGQLLNIVNVVVKPGFKKITLPVLFYSEV
ncbi:hypothetical protein QUB05_22200 [Microcoleus sp. F10-C6]|uniref:hypothetical protein n=1 Tax=unclassified Microcoleus TaxID=2642155 RepID=UPI002FD2C104